MVALFFHSMSFLSQNGAVFCRLRPCLGVSTISLRLKIAVFVSLRKVVLLIAF
jgi:hypothetical protein